MIYENHNKGDHFFESSYAGSHSKIGANRISQDKNNQQQHNHSSLHSKNNISDMLGAPKIKERPRHDTIQRLHEDNEDYC